MRKRLHLPQTQTTEQVFQKTHKQETSAALAAAERELTSLIAKKRVLDKTLANIEANIYALEGAYLEETAVHGNIIKGFEGYLAARPDRKRNRITDADRIFSQSSVTFVKVWVEEYLHNKDHG